MNEELQNAIQQLITKTLDGVDTSIDFLSGELPDYIYQLILWYGIYNFILFASGVVILAIAWIVPYKFRAEIKGCGMDWDNGPGWQILWIPSAFISIPVIISMINLTWLKIWIAPKVWLVEYAASMVK